MATQIRPPMELASSTLLGKTDISQTIHLNIGLNPAKPAAFQALANSVSDPRSPNFRKFLTPSEIGQQFGPSKSTVNNVVNYLTSKGISVKFVSPNRLNIMADATVGQAEAAFNTEIDNYQSNLPSDVGRPAFYSISSAVQLPSSLSRFIVSVSGLENYRHGRPSSKGMKQSGTSGPFGPQQVSSLYDLAPLQAQGYNGQGRTVGITNFDGFDLTNVPLFVNGYGLPAPSAGAGSNISVVTIDGGSESGNESGEGDLDIEMVIGQAPLCNLRVYDAVNNTGVIWICSQKNPVKISPIPFQKAGSGISPRTRLR